MSRELIWTALGLFGLNLAALIGWALTYRPRLVVISGRDERTETPPSSARTVNRIASVWTRAASWAIRGLPRLAAAARRRGRRALSASRAMTHRVRRPADVAPEATSGRDEELERLPDAGDALERWLSEMDAGDRAETGSLDGDPDRWWQVWAETHGSNSPDGGNDSPQVAGSGRSRRQRRPPDAATTA